MKTKLLIALIIVSNITYSQSKAIYTVTFQSVWNSSDHGTLPGNAHWSDLVGATHNSNITFLEMGQMASEGIEDVAEGGNDTVFEQEVMDAIGLGFADKWYDEDFAPFAAISSATWSNIEVDENFSLLTLASMIAPSPDWMIAVNSVSLRENGNWIPLITIDMFPYDAGTESGFGYSGSNPASNPQGVITNVAGAAGYPFNSSKIGTLTIELQQILNVSEFENNTNVRLYPNPSKDVINITAPTNGNTINQIVVYDILGKTVLTSQSNTKIDVSALNTGIYIAKFTFDNGITTTKKVIKD